MTATYPLARPSAFAANATNPLATLDSDLVNLTDTLNGLGNGVSVIATATITTSSITNANITNAFIANANIAAITANTAVFISPLGIGSGGTNATTFGNNAVVVITAGSMVGVLPGGNGTVLTSNGTSWGPASIPASPVGSPITNSIAADVLLNNTANYFDGPSVAQGTTGTWFVSGTVTLLDTVGSVNFDVKLWDGTTVIASGYASTNATNEAAAVALSGFITAPAGNLRISARDVVATSGVMKFNASGNSKDSTITAFRIA